MGVQEAKPLEADEFLNVKSGFIKIMIMNILKKYVKIFQRGRVRPALDPPLISLCILRNKKKSYIVTFI